MHEKLDAIIELLAVDKGDHLDQLVNGLDETEREILVKTQDWTSPSEFKEEVAEAADQSTRTVTRRAKGLADRGLLQVQGTGSGKEYKRTPLVSQVSRIKNAVGGEHDD